MKTRILLVILTLGLAVAGCASPDNMEASAANDPLEPMNRFFFDFNQHLDRRVAAPAATVYASNVPTGVRRPLRNFLSNLGGPVTVVNNILQTNFENAGDAAARFVVNSTLGVGGIFDVATEWGLKENNRDFGETLGGYGVPQGPYLVLPFRGPTAVRDFAGNYVDGFFSPLYYMHIQFSGKQYVGLVKSTIGSVENRAANIVTYRDIERASVDFYATMRTYYRQRRQRQIENAQIQVTDLPEF